MRRRTVLIWIGAGAAGGLCNRILPRWLIPSPAADSPQRRYPGPIIAIDPALMWSVGRWAG